MTPTYTRWLVALALAIGAIVRAPGALAAPLAMQEGRITYHIDHPFKEADGWLEARYIKATLDFDAANPAASKFNVVLDATAFSTGNDLRDSHQQEQIDAQTHKSVKFLVSSMVVQSRAGEGDAQTLKVMAYGKMQFHGVVKEVSWPVDVAITATQVTVDCAFNLDIRHYGMEPKSILSIPVSAVVPVKVHLVFKR